MAAPLITITIDGEPDTDKAVDRIKERIIEAATKAVYESSEFHAERARWNIENAYGAADFKPISKRYARWLASIPHYHPDWNENWTEEDLERAAEQIMDNKISMIFTGELLDGIYTTPVTVDEISGLVEGGAGSSAPYSGQLERAFLFGKERPGRERPFFTDHKFETKEYLKKSFFTHVKTNGDDVE